MDPPAVFYRRTAHRLIITSTHQLTRLYLQTKCDGSIALHIPDARQQALRTSTTSGAAAKREIKTPTTAGARRASAKTQPNRSKSTGTARQRCERARGREARHGRGPSFAPKRDTLNGRRGQRAAGGRTLLARSRREDTRESFFALFGKRSKDSRRVGKSRRRGGYFSVCWLLDSLQGSMQHHLAFSKCSCVRRRSKREVQEHRSLHHILVAVSWNPLWLCQHL